MPVQVYTNIRRFKEDLTRYPPHFFICVPLVLDTLYNRVPPFIFSKGNIWYFPVWHVYMEPRHANYHHAVACMLQNVSAWKTFSACVWYCAPH